MIPSNAFSKDFYINFTYALRVQLEPVESHPNLFQNAEQLLSVTPLPNPATRPPHIRTVHQIPFGNNVPVLTDTSKGIFLYMHREFHHNRPPRVYDTAMQWQERPPSAEDQSGPNDRSQVSAQAQRQDTATSEGDGPAQDEEWTVVNGSRRLNIIPEHMRMDTAGDCGESGWIVEEMEESQTDELIQAISSCEPTSIGSCSFDLLQYLQCADVQ